MFPPLGAVSTINRAARGSAAPELLAACQIVAAFYGQFSGNNLSDDESRLLAAARAAIAKAIGETR